MLAHFVRRSDGEVSIKVVSKHFGRVLVCIETLYRFSVVIDVLLKGDIYGEIKARSIPLFIAV